MRKAAAAMRRKIALSQLFVLDAVWQSSQMRMLFFLVGVKIMSI
jgi:hypothetical protein